MAAPTAGRTLSLWSASPGGDAVAGRDLVLEIPAEHGLELPVGAGLDDHLDESTRLLVDRRARERFREWSERRSAALTVEGLDLTSICELELLAQCFVPAARLDIALPRAIEVAGARALTLRALAPGIAGVIRAVAAREGVATSELSEAASGATMRWRGPSTAVRAVAAAGLPARVRGRVLCVPYPNLTPVLRRLAAGDARTRPVASGVLVPGLDLRSALETAARGGWLGYPGARARRLAGQPVASAIDAAARGPVQGDELARALDAWALAYVREHAPGVLASARRARRVFGAHRVRALVVPFDEPPAMAGLVTAARSAGVPSLIVQHGYDAELGVRDKTRVDVAALWSERDGEILRAESPARGVVTGNPAAEQLVEAPPRAARRDRTLVLVDYHSRLSARVPERVSQRHLEAALEAIAVARPGTTAVVRPHPSTHGAEARIPGPSGLRVEVDASAPIEGLLSGVDACIGAMSTATLQAAGHGVPVVYLDVAGLERPPPFDGSAVPVARDAEQLADALAAAVARPDVTGQAEMLDALGARPNATGAVCDIVEQLVERAGSPGA